MTYIIKTNSVKETQLVAEKIGRWVQPGMVLTLEGDLGAGKTTFTKGFAKGLDIKRNVNSPTFTIIKEYQGRLPLYHMDVYRLENGAEDMGLDDYLFGEGVCVVEWASMIEDILPKERLDIKVYREGENDRRIELTPVGEFYESVKEVLSKMFVLAIDTSNTTLSVALVENKETLAEIVESTKNDHSKRLMPAIESLFKQVNRSPKELDLIAVAEGPGSYTGVRIGVTVAKTLAWTLSKPLVGVSSLEILARNINEDAYVVPLFDARRQTVFAGVYQGASGDVVIPDGHYELVQLLDNLSSCDKKVYFLGSDVERYWDLIVEKLEGKVVKVEDVALNTPYAHVLANLALEKDSVENVHHFTPKYHRLPEAEMNWIQEQKNKGL